MAVSAVKASHRGRGEDIGIAGRGGGRRRHTRLLPGLLIRYISNSPAIATPLRKCTHKNEEMVWG